MYRELYEEVGLHPEHIEIVGRTREWLYYDLPEHFLRNNRRGQSNFRGQKQVWYLLRLVCEEDQVCLTRSRKPEFEDWEWVDYWKPVEQVVDFKREVYEQALRELEPFLEQLNENESEQ